MKGKANPPATERPSGTGTPKPSPALVRFDPGPRGSRTLLPNDHVKALVELLRGQTPDLARRWLSALLIVPERERESVVNAVERSVVAEYAQSSEADERVTRAGARDAQRESHTPGESESTQLRVVYPPTQKQGYVETVEKSFEVVGDAQTASESEHQSKTKGGRGVKGSERQGRRGGSSGA